MLASITTKLGVGVKFTEGAELVTAQAAVLSRVSLSLRDGDAAKQIEKDLRNRSG